MNTNEYEKATGGVMEKITAALDEEGVPFFWHGGFNTRIWADANEETLLAQVTSAEIESEDRDLLAKRKVDQIRATLATS